MDETWGKDEGDPGFSLHVDRAVDEASGIPRADALDHRRLMRQIEAPFDASRSKPWPVVVGFLEGLEPDGWVLDLAAGNGRHALEAARLGHRVLAVDVARGLMRKVRARSRAQGPPVVECTEADMLALPLAQGSVANAVFAAGLHCIRGRSDRVASVRELTRVLRPGGSAIVTVWWRDPERFGGAMRRTGRRSRSIKGASHRDAPGWEEGDVVLPWRHAVEVPVDRFFHLYEVDELREDLVAGGLEPGEVRRERFGSTWNLVVVVEKTARR